MQGGGGGGGGGLVDGKCKREKEMEWQNNSVCLCGRRGSLPMEMGEIKIEMDRRGEERGRGCNELMTVLTTRCLLSPAQTQPMK